MLLQKPPSQPPSTSPGKVAASHSPIISESTRAGARREISASPTGARCSSPTVTIDEIADQPAAGLPCRPARACQAAAAITRLASATHRKPNASLAMVDSSATEPRLPRPQLDEDRREHENHQRVEREEPGGRDLALPEAEIDPAVGVILGPQQQRVALLVVGRPEERHQHEHAEQADDRAPFVGAERLCARHAPALRAVQFVGRQIGAGRRDRSRVPISMPTPAAAKP